MIEMPGQRGFKILLGNFLQQSRGQLVLLGLDQKMLHDLRLVEQAAGLQQGKALIAAFLRYRKQQLVGHPEIAGCNLAYPLCDLADGPPQILQGMGPHPVVENNVRSREKGLGKIVSHEGSLVRHRPRAPDNIILLCSIHRRNSLCHIKAVP